MGEIYNIGCNEDMEISIFDLAKLIHKLSHTTKSFKDILKYIEDRPFNDQRYYIENKKLKNLGWKITKNLEEGIKELINK